MLSVSVLSLICSSLTLTFIACDRFFGIVFVLKSQVIQRKAHHYILVVWLVAVATSLPLLLFREQHERQWLDHTEIWCDDAWPVHDADVSVSSRRVYYTVVSALLYFLPIVVMSLVYAVIMRKLMTPSVIGERVDTGGGGGSGSTAQDRVRKRVSAVNVRRGRV